MFTHSIICAYKTYYTATIAYSDRNYEIKGSGGVHICGIVLDTNKDTLSVAVQKLSEEWDCNPADIIMTQETSTSCETPIIFTIPEKITSAAILFILVSDNPDIDGKIMILSGKYHGDAFKALHDMGLKYRRDFCVQGFWTDHQRFVNRLDAWRIAKNASQFKNPEMAKLEDQELFSEDIDMSPPIVDITK